MRTIYKGQEVLQIVYDRLGASGKDIIPRIGEQVVYDNTLYLVENIRHHFEPKGTSVHVFASRPPG